MVLTRRKKCRFITSAGPQINDQITGVILIISKCIQILFLLYGVCLTVLSSLNHLFGVALPTLLNACARVAKLRTIKRLSDLMPPSKSRMDNKRTPPSVHFGVPLNQGPTFRLRFADQIHKRFGRWLFRSLFCVLETI